LHNHLVRECPKTLEELYEEFRKFSRAEILHFCKLGQQRKAVNENKSSRPFKYNKGKEGAPTFDTTHKQVHSIDSDGCRPSEIWEKILDIHVRKAITECTTPEEITNKPEAVTPAEAKVGVKVKKGLSIACSTRKTLTIGQGIVPFS
jgi:hypothetical protein